MAPPHGPAPAELADLALSIARTAAGLVRRRRAEGVEVADRKSSATDIVTEADRASEELIRRLVLEARPDDAIMGEEGADLAGTSGLEWVVDPIDGTVNYFLGLPNYAVSIAVRRGDEVLAGAVVNPATGEEFVASRGGGARRNGAALRVREPREPARMVVGTGFGYDPGQRARQAAAVAELLPRVADIRRFGSCALDLCMVAAGQLDAYVEEGVNTWDHAAAGLVAAEAGATVELLAGASGRTLVVAAPAPVYTTFSQLVVACGFAAASARE